MQSLFQNCSDGNKEKLLKKKKNGERVRANIIK